MAIKVIGVRGGLSTGPQILPHSISRQVASKFSNWQPQTVSSVRKKLLVSSTIFPGVQVLSAMGVCFQTRGRFQQGSEKIDWARRPGCATVIFNGVTKASDLLQHIRPLTGLLNSISEGDAFSGLKTDPHGAFHIAGDFKRANACLNLKEIPIRTERAPLLGVGIRYD
jgi:hypothetical protein